MRNTVIGIILIVIGLCFFAVGAVRPKADSNFIVKLMLARPAACFGEEKAYTALMVYGIMMTVFSVLFLTGVIPSKD